MNYYNEIKNILKDLQLNLGKDIQLEYLKK